MPTPTSTLSFALVNTATSQSSSGSGFVDLTGMILDGSTEKLGIRFQCSDPTALTEVNVRLNVVGAPGNLRMGVYDSDASFLPNALLGDWTATFAAPGADGETGWKALQTNTGALTVGALYWIVIEYVSGTIDGSNYVQLQRTSQGSEWFYSLTRHHNGTNWTTTSAQTVVSVYGHKNSDNRYGGFLLFTTAPTRSTVTDIFGSNKQGIRLRFGAQIRIYGIRLQLAKSGSPSSLVITVYEGDTEKQSATVVAGLISNSNFSTWAVFASPALLSADADINIVLSQESAGGTDANDYDIYVNTFDAQTEMEDVQGTRCQLVSGSGSPSALTASTTEQPVFQLLSEPLDAGLDYPAGGGLLTNPGMGGRLV